VVDVEATPAHKLDEINATKTMIERVETRFDLRPQRLIGDTNYGTAEILGWMVDEKQIEPHVSVWDKTQRNDETLSSSDFKWNEEADEYRCPQGRVLRRQWRPFKNLRTHVTKADTIIYRSSQSDCATCPMKARCCPNTPTRKIARSVHESARDVARDIAKSRAYKQSRKDRKKVEMLFAHLKRILKLDRPAIARTEWCSRRVSSGRNRAEPTTNGEVVVPGRTRNSKNGDLNRAGTVSQTQNRAPPVTDPLFA
jgi:hypothetical protein